jgi:iron complex transport system substrate-binding protein
MALARTLTICFIMILAGTGCSRNIAEVAVKNQPINRIISAAPSNTEIIIGLGMGERLVAVDRHSRDIQGVLVGLPLIDFFFPNAEAIIGLEPDLILTNEVNSFGVADNPFKLLGNLGIRVVQVPTSTNIEGIYGDILLIAETLEVKERGDALVKSMRTEIEKITAGGNTSEARNRKRVYFEISAMPTMVSFGRGAYLNEMIEIAGGKNIFADQEGWFSPSAEEIINRNPEIIFALAYAGEDPVSEIMNRRIFEGVAAVKLNQVYAIDMDSASRPSQHILQALQEMALAINKAHNETMR